MAHFILTVDPDSGRRKTFAAGAGKALEALPELTLKVQEQSDFAGVWAHHPRAPFSQQADPENCGALLGYAVDDSGTWLDAASLGALWRHPGSPDRGLGGYFAGAAWSRNELRVGGDLLGFFPIYFAEVAGVVLAGSSPELFSAHPLFRAELDERGLTGILLLNGLLNNQTLLRGVRRLKPGAQLHWTRQAGAREVEVFRPGLGEPPTIHTAGEALEQAHAEMQRTLRWHRPRQSRSVLMLSGGLDSRLMAGYLQAEGITDAAICLGRPHDLEVDVGSRVAAALGMTLAFEPQEPGVSECLASAHRLAKWEHLSAGFSHLEMTPAARHVGGLAPMFWSGFVLEDVLGNDAAVYGLDARTGQWSFDTLFRGLNAWGISPDNLARLLRAPHARELVESCRAEFRQEYENSGVLESQRAMRTKLLNRARLHVGTLLHRLAFQSWPLLPLLDRRFLETQFNVPVGFKVNRQLQKNLLHRHFPRLSAIPREHNSFWLEPLQPSPLSRVAASLEKKIRRWYWQKWKRSEPRRYFRCYDLNEPPWREVRAAAEPLREGLEPWLNRGELDRCLPPMEDRLRFETLISGSGGCRLLLGLLLWTKR